MVTRGGSHEASLLAWLRDEFGGQATFAHIREKSAGKTAHGVNPIIEFEVEDGSAFFVFIEPGDRLIRVGLKCVTREANEAIEQAVLDSGETLQEILEDGMEADEDLEHPARHFEEDDIFYYCSDLPYVNPEDLDSDDFRDEILLYLQGYYTGLGPFLDE